MAAYTPQILDGGTVDCDEIRGYLGVVLGFNSQDIPDVIILSESILGEAEAVILDQHERQGSNVPTLVQILNNTSPAKATDKINLRNAVRYYAAKLLCPSLTNALNVSQTTTLGKMNKTVDRGGIGAQWTTEEQRAEAESYNALLKITGWRHFRQLPTS